MDPKTQAQYLEVISQAGETIQAFAGLVDSLSQKIRDMQQDRSDLDSSVDVLAEILDTHPVTTTGSIDLVGAPQPSNPTPGTDGGLKAVHDMGVEDPEMMNTATAQTVDTPEATDNDLISGVFDQIAEAAAEMPID